MIIDGLTMHYLASELRRNLLDARVDKIVQLDKHVFVLSCRSKSGQSKLFIDVSAKNSALYLTRESFQAPLKAPAFSMFLRKYLLNGRIVDIKCPDFERYIIIEIEVSNNFKDLVTYKLLIELMGRYTNLILLDENNIIKDCVNHIDADINSFREIMPLRPYVAPPAQSYKQALTEIADINALTKLLFVQTNTQAADAGAKENTEREATTDRTAGELKIKDLLISKIKGLSPTVCNELLLKAACPNITISTLTTTQREHIVNVVWELAQFVRAERLCPALLVKNKIPAVISPLELNCTALAATNVETLTFTSLSEAMAHSRLNRSYTSAFSQKRQLLLDKIEKTLSKQLDKLARYQEEIKASKDLLLDKLQAELILINKPGIEQLLQKSYDRSGADTEHMPCFTPASDSENCAIRVKNHYTYALPEEYFQELSQLTQNEDEQLAYLDKLASDPFNIAWQKNKNISHNAAAYFKKYGKKKQRLLILGEFVKELQQDLQFMQNCRIDVANAENDEDLESIARNLSEIAASYQVQAKHKFTAMADKSASNSAQSAHTAPKSATPKQEPGKPAGGARIQLAKKLLKASNFRNFKQSATARNKEALTLSKENYLKFLSSDGLNILVGKNAAQNDYISMKLAKKDDIWLHLQKAPGCHVVIQLQANNKQLPERTLLEAAALCAWFSSPLEQRKVNSALLQAAVKVDYCQAGKLKKQAHAKPGLVYYNNYQTLTVVAQAPEISGLKRLL